MMKLIAAKQHQRPLKMGISGFSGSGKTYTSLKIAAAFAGQQPIVVIDSEHGSSSRYSNQFDFLVCELESHTPKDYLDAIALAKTANPAVVIIDSLSHLWFWELETAGKDKNSFTGWRNVRPQEREVFEAIVRLPMAAIVTTRATDRYEMKKDEKGKSVPVLTGHKIVQSKDIEYEFDIFGHIDRDHVLHVSKSRCFELQDKTFRNPGDNLASALKDWIGGEESSLAKGDRLKSARQKAGLEASEVKAWMFSNIRTFDSIGELTSEEIDRIIAAIESGELYEGVQNENEEVQGV